MPSGDPHPCPNCGHCPTCGRSHTAPPPWNWPITYPWQPVYPTRPWWGVIPPNTAITFDTNTIVTSGVPQ